MTGAHRRTRKKLSAALLQAADFSFKIAVVITVPLAILAVVAFGFYHGLTSNAVPGTITIAIIGALWAATLGYLAWELSRHRPHKPAQTLSAIDSAWTLALATVSLLLIIGEHFRWTSSPFNDTTTAAYCVVALAYVAYRKVGRSRLGAALEERAAARQSPA